MADKDTSNNDELDTSVDEVETDEDTSTEDEINETENQEDSEDDAESNDDSEDDSEDDSDEDEDDDEDKEPEFKKAFSTIQGDTPEEYIPNLEEAYRKSSREGKKLAQDKREMQERLDLITTAIANNPELAKALDDATKDGVAPTIDPALAMARQSYEEKVEKDLSAFMEEHPDLETDEELAEEFFENVATIGAASRKKGKIIDPMVAYKKAWGMMDYDDSKEKLATAAKNTASKPKTTSSKKAQPKSKPKLTPEQIAYGKKMGLTEKQLLDSIKD